MENIDVDVVHSMEEVRERCLFMLEQAEQAALSVGRNTQVLLPNAFNTKVNNHLEIIAIGSKIPFHFFWQKTPERVVTFATRLDYHHNDQCNRATYKKYHCSRFYVYTKEQLLESLDKGGRWAAFLNINEKLLERFKCAIEEGTFEEANSEINFTEIYTELDCGSSIN